MILTLIAVAEPVVARMTNTEAARRLDRLSPTRSLRRRRYRLSPTRLPATAERSRYIRAYTYKYMRICTDTCIFRKIHTNTYKYLEYLHINLYTYKYMRIYTDTCIFRKIHANTYK
jgi:hypothetical protein